MEIKHNRPTFPTTYAKQTLDSGYLGMGDKCAELEKKWCEITQSDESAAVSSGTSALRLALQALEGGPGDEVIIPGYACSSLHCAVLSVGATPVLADIKEDLTIDPTDVYKQVKCSNRYFETDGPMKPTKVKAIIAVHLFGAQADIDKLEMGIPIIEDFSHGIFTQRGTLGIVSHGPTKLIGSPSGGIVSGSKELINKVRDLRSYVDKPVSTKMNDLPNDLSASIALEQLERLPGIKNKRAMAAARYDEWIHDFGLAEIELISRQTNSPYRFCIRLKHHLAHDISLAMQEKGVEALQPVFDPRLFMDWPKDLPVADESYRHIISLPFYEDITAEQQERVIMVLGECLK